MKHALLSLLGLFTYSGGAAVFGAALLQLVDNNITSPIILLAMVFGVIAGFLAAVIGFIYAWEHMCKM